MERFAINSENLQAIQYNGVDHTLEVEFKNGGTYQYFDVPRRVVLGLLSASSKGRYFNDRIRRRFAAFRTL